MDPKAERNKALDIVTDSDRDVIRTPRGRLTPVAAWRLLTLAEHRLAKYRATNPVVCAILGIDYTGPRVP